MTVTGIITAIGVAIVAGAYGRRGARHIDTVVRRGGEEFALVVTAGLAARVRVVDGAGGPLAERELEFLDEQRGQRGRPRPFRHPAPQAAQLAHLGRDAPLRGPGPRADVLARPQAG